MIDAAQFMPARTARRSDPTGICVHPAIRLTRPLYATAYALVRRAAAPPLRSLADAGDRRIALEGESVPVFTLRQQGRRVLVLADHDAVLRAVTDGRAPYGYLWAPIAAWRLRERRDVVLAPEFASGDRWAFAVAVRAADTTLRARLDLAVAIVRRDGVVDAICRRYDLAPCAPSP